MVRPSHLLAGFLTLTLVLIVVVGEYRYTERVARSKVIFAEASGYEVGGNLKAAYLSYSSLCEGELEIKREDVPKGACEGVERLWARRVEWER
jgi:hypothetical protein